MTADPFFTNFLEVQGFGPSFAKDVVPETSFARYRGRLPEVLLGYWERYGWCGFGQGLLWLVNPEEWEVELSTWLDGTPFVAQDDFHVIARTAFGGLVLWGERTGQSLKVNSPYGMVFPSFDKEAFDRRGPDKALQLSFASFNRGNFDLIDEAGESLFDKALAALGPVDKNTMYGFVPALALGGVVKVEALKKVDVHVHLDLLSQVTRIQIMEDVRRLA